MSAGSRRETLDAIAVGGGAVALFVALLLHQKGMRVALVAASGPASLDAAEASLKLEQNMEREPDARVYALAPDVCSALPRCGIDIATLPRAQPYKSMHVWDAAASLQFESQEYGWSSLGLIVEHRVLLAALWCAVYQAGINCSLAQATLQFDARGALLEIGAERMRAHLILAADGHSSALREAAGIALQRHDFLQHALVFNVQTAVQQRCAWQRFFDGNTLAFLPLANRYCNIVWSMPNAAFNKRAALSDAALLAALQAASQGKLGALAKLGVRQSFALHQHHAERYVEGELVLLGDAAHSVHPMAGQGLNIGLRDALCLADKLQNIDLSSAAKQRSLRRYERERISENAITMLGINSLHEIFKAERGPLALLRRGGVDLVHRIRPIKRLLAELAAGKTAGWP